MEPAALLHTVLTPLLWAFLGVVAWQALRVLWLPRWRGRVGETRVGQALGRLFAAVAHDVILPDPRGGLTQIDHLALTPAGILVVETKHYSGWIFGQANEATWTQTLGRRRNRFQNPLRQNHAHACAVEALAPGVPVLRRVVFTDAAKFPNGRCAGVSQLATLEADLAAWRQGEVSPALRDAWQRLLANAKMDPKTRKAHLEGLRARHGKRPSGLSPWAIAPVALLAPLALTGLWRTTDQPQTPATHPTQRQTIAVRPAPAAPHAPPSLPLPSTRPPAPSKPQAVAAIDWAGPKPTPSQQSEVCKQAIVATLIDNTAENRAKRTAACGNPSNGSEP